MKEIRRKTVNKALELLWANKKIKVKRLEKSEKSENTQCKLVHHYKKSERQCSAGFSKNKILSEIKLHAHQKNWSKVKNLFLLLLNLNSDIEPCIWRYSFVLTLYSNVDNASNVSQFFETCIGSLDSDKNLILKNMLSLQHRK